MHTTTAYNTADNLDLLTVQQAADLLQISTDFLYQASHRGTGPKKIKIGKLLRYRRVDLADWIAENNPQN